MTEKKKVTRKKIEAAADMNRLMADYYHELDHASKTGDKKVAWCSSVGPAEILTAMGFLVYFPENHSAMLGAARMATEFIPHANALGYSPDICSYLTADVGAFLQGITPLKGLGLESVPKPDVLVYNTNQCRAVQDWFAWFAREFDAPLVGIQSYRGVDEVSDAHISSITEQMKRLIEPLEEMLRAEEAEERVAAAKALVPLGKGEVALPALLEAAGSDAKLLGQAAGILPWLVWDERFRVFHQMRQLAHDKR